MDDDFIHNPGTFDTFNVIEQSEEKNVSNNSEGGINPLPVQAKDIPDIFKTSSFIDNFSGNIMEQDFDDNIAMEDTREDGRVILPKDLTMSKPEIDLLNKMLLSDSLSQAELDKVFIENFSFGLVW